MSAAPSPLTDEDRRVFAELSELSRADVLTEEDRIEFEKLKKLLEPKP